MKCSSICILDAVAVAATGAAAPVLIPRRRKNKLYTKLSRDVVHSDGVLELEKKASHL